MLDPADIKSVAVHPGIGIARVGDAMGADDYFFGPETPGTGPRATNGFRNAEGHIKRQAARFRIYATLDSGEVIELTAGKAKIEWRVQLANLKAGWYRFTTAMDLPRNLAVSTTRRNPEVGLHDVDVGFLRRASLEITPSPKTISGVNSAPLTFDDGAFFGTPVYLGELRTDDQGRLIVLGGRGATGTSPADTPAPTFANNDGWHDDVSDGPVRATVTIGDTVFEADPGYVVVTPPNFGPGLFGPLTMDDVVQEAFYGAGFCEPPAKPSFTRNIWPVFDRLSGNQWVNQGVFLLHGQGSPLDARDPDVVERLADPTDDAKSFRQAIFRLFRSPLSNRPDLAALPPFYGDGIDYSSADVRFLPLDTSADLTLTPTLYRMLGKWADGDFEADWVGFPEIQAFDKLKTADQPRALDRANLYDVLGGPFHPGIELTWIMRQPSLWKGEYRLRLSVEGVRTRQDFGPELTPEICLGPTGPLSETGPGGLTRWLGVPWQTDGGSCSSGGEYTPQYYLSVPSFWGARVPNDVLPQAAYERMIDPALNPVQRAKHFNSRRGWYRLVNVQDSQKRAQTMVTEWWRQGIVEPVEPPEALGYGEILHIEIATVPDQPQNDPTYALITDVEHIGGAGDGALGVAAAEQPRKVFAPPRIHYGRGDI
jgi:L-Lysine epsilon oxidase N-terminal/L-lysine epsilon oxidase C-terminal domain